MKGGLTRTLPAVACQHLSSRLHHQSTATMRLLSMLLVALPICSAMIYEKPYVSSKSSSKSETGSPHGLSKSDASNQYACVSQPPPGTALPQRSSYPQFSARSIAQSLHVVSRC